MLQLAIHCWFHHHNHRIKYNARHTEPYLQYFRCVFILSMVFWLLLSLASGGCASCRVKCKIIIIIKCPDRSSYATAHNCFPLDSKNIMFHASPVSATENRNGGTNDGRTSLLSRLILIIMKSRRTTVNGTIVIVAISHESQGG